MTKTCRACGLDKPIADFGKNSSKADGVQTQCKGCRKATNAATYQRTKDKHRDRRAAQVKAYRRANQAHVLSHLLENPCVDCGERDPVVLQFDHQRDKVRDVAVLIQRSSLVKLIAEIEKCEVVCANCHIRRTSRTQGWWKHAAVAELV